MALYFINNTGTSIKMGEFTYETIDYEYTLYLMPLNLRTNIGKSIKNELIDYFGNRKVKISEFDSEGNKIYKESLCLNLDETFYRQSINYISAFVKVNPKGVDNIASATIQIYDHCEENPDKTDLQYAQVWINDVCRVSNIPGNPGNPVKGLFYFIEQLTIQNLGKNTVKLFVDKEPKNLTVLQKKYENLGFKQELNDEECERVMIYKNTMVREKEMEENQRIQEENERIQQENETLTKKRKRKKLNEVEITEEWNNIIMSKTNIVPNPNIINLSLQPEIQEEPISSKISSSGGKRIKKQKNKVFTRKIRRNKLNTRKIKFNV